MALPFKTFLNLMVSRLDSTKPEIRKYMNLKPHVMVLDSGYLRALGLSSSQIAEVHTLAKNKAKFNKGSIDQIAGWNPVNETLLLIGGNNLDRAKGISRKINSYLGDKTVRTTTISTSTEDVERRYESRLSKFTSAVDAATTKHGLKITSDLKTIYNSSLAKSELIIAVAPLSVNVSKEVEKSIADSIGKTMLETGTDVSGVVDNLENVLVATFLGNTIKPKKDSKKDIRTIKGSRRKSTFTPLPPLPKGIVGINLFKLKSILNALLHDVIQGRMAGSAAPASKAYLRYQTGRFASSAKVNDIKITRNDLISVKYSYLQYPYDTFLPPEGKQSSYGRSPRRYIANSIRDILISQLGTDIKVRSTVS